MLIQRSQVLPTLAIYVMLNQIPHVLPTLSNHIKALNFWVLGTHVNLEISSSVNTGWSCCANSEISCSMNIGYLC